MSKIKKKVISLIFALAALLFIYPMNAYAADAQVRFGSEQYDVENNEAFYIGVYIESESNIGDFDVQLAYNPQFLTYVTGATSGGEGTIDIQGTADGKSMKYLVAFQALAGGDTSLDVISANVQNADAKETLNVSTYLSAPIYMKPNANALLNGISINGDKLDAFAPESMTYDVQVDADTDKLDIDTDNNNLKVTVSDTALKEEQTKVYISVADQSNNANIYTLNVTKKQGTATTETTMSNEQNPQSNNETTGNQNKSSGISIGKVIVIILVVIVLLVAIGYIGLLLYAKKRKTRFKKNNSKNSRKKESTQEEYQAEELEDSETYTNLYQEVQQSFAQTQKQPELEEVKATRQERQEQNTESEIVKALKKAEHEELVDKMNKLDEKKVNEADKQQPVQEMQENIKQAPKEDVEIDKDMIDISFINQELEKRMNKKDPS